MINFFKKKIIAKNNLPIWLDDCYDEDRSSYQLDQLSGWFKQIQVVDWGTDTATSLYLITKSNTISDLISLLNTFNTFFDPLDSIDRNVNIPLPLPREGTSKSYYEYFVNHEKMEFHPLRVASGIAVLLTRINEKLLAAPERYLPTYKGLVNPLIREVILVARALEIIYVIK